MQQAHTGNGCVVTAAFGSFPTSCLKRQLKRAKAVFLLCAAEQVVYRRMI
jgi:hypothetical protein